MHLDTHATIWLYESGTDTFPAAARSLLDTEPLAISPMVRFELAFLYEIGRITPPPDVIVAGLSSTVGLVTSLTSFVDVIGAAKDLTWTRDPFDRLICAQAVAENAILLTKDRKIRANLTLARWDEPPPDLDPQS